MHLDEIGKMMQEYVEKDMSSDGYYVKYRLGSLDVNFRIKSKSELGETRENAKKLFMVELNKKGLNHASEKINKQESISGEH